MTDRTIRRYLIIICLLSLGFRVIIALLISPVLSSDSLEYHQYAVNLVKEHKYYIIYTGKQAPLRGGIYYSFRPPGYPFFLAGIYAFLGIHPKLVSVFQAVLDILSGIFIFLIASTWLKPKEALWALIASQTHFLYVPMVLSETLFLFLFSFSLWILLSQRGNNWLWMILNGLAWGWIVLTKPEKIIFVPLFFVYYLWKNYSRSACFKSLAGFGIMMLVIMPWLWREKKVHGKWVWISSRGGRTFFEGNYLPIEMRKVYAEARKAELDELEMDRLFYQVSFRYLKAHPRQYFKAGLKRVWLLFDLRLTNWLYTMLFHPLLSSGGFWGNFFALLGLFIFNCYRLVVISGTIGAIIFWRKFRELSLIYAILVLMIIFHFFLFIGASRYLVPGFPSLCIFFALLVQKLGAIFPLRNNTQVVSKVNEC